MILCDVCQKPITPKQGYIHHQRLAANVHMGCPRTDVKGEDISGHTVIYCKVPDVSRDY